MGKVILSTTKLDDAFTGLYIGEGIIHTFFEYVDGENGLMRKKKLFQNVACV